MASGFKECGIFAKHTGFSKLIHSNVYAYWRFNEFRGSGGSNIYWDSEGEVVQAHLNRLIIESNNKHLCMCKCETCWHNRYVISIFLILLDY